MAVVSFDINVTHRAAQAVKHGCAGRQRRRDDRRQVVLNQLRHGSSCIGGVLFGTRDDAGVDTQAQLCGQIRVLGWVTMRVAAKVVKRCFWPARLRL